MAAALEANQKRLVEAEKLAGVGRLAAGVAHEINNPIAVILGYTSMLLKDLPQGSAQRERVLTIADEARQCKNIVDGLLDLSRPSDPTSGEVVNPAEVVSDVLNALRALGLADGVQTEDSVISCPLPLTISRARLRQLALNIVRNAMEVLQSREDGLLQIEGYIRPREKLQSEMLKEADPHSGSYLVLVFTDNGPGLPPNSRARLFEPFFTTKPAGMGLGLAIVYNIVSAHDGFIEVDSADGVGTSFTVGLPLEEEQ
jgi:signal transduction histidine kinase